MAKLRCKQLFLDEKENIYHCATPGCSMNSKFKGNIVRHMKDSAQQQLRNEQKADNIVCHYCGKTFVQKSNRDCHVRNNMKMELLSIHTQMKLLMRVLLP